MTTTGTGRNLNRDEIADALSFLDPSCDRKEWIRIGAAVKAAGAAIGEDLFEVWRAWSERGDGYNAKTIASDWKALLRGGSEKSISAGTLVYLAKAKGWIDPRMERVTLAGSESNAAPRRKAPAEMAETDPATIADARQKVAKTLERDGYRIVAEYRYSEDFFVYRLENGKGSKTIRPLSFDGYSWAPKAPEGLRPLYNLEQIVAADPKEMVFVVEGEKCVDAAKSVGLVATTSSNGSQSAGRTDWSALHGRSVVIVPDRDAAGEAYATSVEKILRGLNCEIRILRIGTNEASQLDRNTRLNHRSHERVIGRKDYPQAEPTPTGFDLADWVIWYPQELRRIFVSRVENDTFGIDPSRFKAPTPEEMRDLLRRLAADQTPVARRSESSLLDDLEGFEESLAETHGLEFIGLPSGCFPRLDSMLDGWRGLGVLAAEPGIGKTTLLLQTGLGIVTTNEDAAFVFVSLEMGRTAMMWRLVSQTTRIPYRTLRKGEKDKSPGEDDLHFSEQTRSRLRRGLENLRDLAPRIAILDLEDFSGGISVEEFGERLVQRVEAFKAKTGCSRAFVVVDHLGKLPTGPQANLSTLERDDAKISALLAAQRRLESDSIVVISQVRKSDYERPGLASAKGSAEISYSPDFYIAAWRPDKGSQDASEYGVDLPKETYFACEIVKGRDGMIRGRVEMKFLVDEHRIEEVR